MKWVFLCAALTVLLTSFLLVANYLDFEMSEALIFTVCLWNVLSLFVNAFGLAYFFKKE